MSNDKIIDKNLASILTDSTRVQILKILYDKKTANISTISEEINRHRSTVFRHLDKLVKTGLVRRYMTVGGYVYELTEKGTDIAKFIINEKRIPLIILDQKENRKFKNLCSKIFKVLAIVFTFVAFLGFTVQGIHALSRLIWFIIFLLLSYISLDIARKI